MKGRWAQVLILIGCSALLFGASLFHEFVWDDAILISSYSRSVGVSDIPRLFTTVFSYGTNGGGLFSFYYKPIPFLSFVLIRTILGEQPFFFHLVQLAFATANGVLVFFLFTRFFPLSWATIMAFVFLAHPGNVESVVYVSALQDTLYLFFGLLSVVLASGKASLLRLAAIALLLLASLLSKETGAIFLVLTPLYVFLFSGRKAAKKLLIASVISGALYVSLRAVAATNTSGLSIDTARIMTESLIIRLMTMPKVFVHYVSLFLFPLEPLIEQRWVTDRLTIHDFFIPLLLSLGTILFLAVLSVRFRRGNERNPYLFFAAFFLLSVSVHLQIIPLDMTVADRWFYAQSIGLIGIAGLLIHRFRKHVPPNMLRTLIAVVCILLTVRTGMRVRNWRDNLTLFAHDASIAPNYQLVHSLAANYFRQGNYLKAAEAYERMRSYQPDSSDALNGLGAVAFQEGNKTKALALFEAATRVPNPGVFAYLNRVSLLSTEATESAKEVATEALGVFPENPWLWLILSEIEARRGNAGFARVAYEEYLKLAPKTGQTQDADLSGANTVSVR